ncbi:RNA 2',3'-cyclic phosphodiesterase [Methanobrevibacter arboriphilus]|uniref:RNA 2',3'-cyclic phosphodiesterase n=1 Tax=Methanobrevibacter arboriphilus TaxID=39441 RepID=A0ACA8R2D8_METAZ|nr:RNA 2',3'-cyclic phosphodiesterase [Methanobrevibacter arboriphilus]MCC7562177.1 RNA 2',3'-cyclic phosphodiesterase [Methanobrevibacter arboriphilus]BBL61426.1 RNA 2',3'-cyclic phosphodiesterase [Methanobrevibacter arboriphilus]GLI11241.1 RNA 2',3'-cyclic phosphodiesterase [Methanobrevibacter arboriphilus]
MVAKQRCFLAIDIDSDLIQNIVKVQEEFKNTNNNVKYVEEENLHFTLKFFGDIDKDKIFEVKNCILKVLNEINFKDNFSNEISIKGLGTFPNKNYMKVLWVGCENSEFITKLHDALDLEFKKIGFKLDKQFKTHITIGRIRNLKDKNEFKSKIEKLENFEIGNMNIEKISLKISELTPKGPIYSNIKVFEL